MGHCPKDRHSCPGRRPLLSFFPFLLFPFLTTRWGTIIGLLAWFAGWAFCMPRWSCIILYLPVGWPWDCPVSVLCPGVIFGGIRSFLLYFSCCLLRLWQGCSGRCRGIVPGLPEKAVTSWPYSLPLFFYPPHRASEGGSIGSLPLSFLG